MSKNLEKEYRDLYEQEMSKVDMDALWNKIEADLPDKPKKKWYQNTRTIQTIGTLAACAVVLLVVSAGFSRSGVFKSQYSASDSNKGTSEAPAQMTTMDSAMNEVEAATEAELPEIFEESDASVSSEGIYTEFEVLSETEEYYLCITISKNDILEEETEIFLTKREVLEVGMRYADNLILVDDESEIKIFEIY